MGLLNTLGGLFRSPAAPVASAPVASATRKPAPVRTTMRRSYAGAEVSNLTSSFNGSHVSINEDLERSLRLLRGRSRQLAKNNDYVKKFLRMVQNHVVGPNGFTLSVNCLRKDGGIDEFDKKIVETVFAKWAKRGVCDVTGRLSFVQLCRLLVLTVARDGEAIVRRVKDSKINGFGYALQVIDPVLLDESYRADFPDGRRIRMGVETNQLGRPLAYHFHGDVESPFGSKRVRVDAAEVWHFFIQEEPNQVRGVPWIHTAMRRLNDLGGYEEAAVIAARIGASNMGFYVPPADSGGNAALLADQSVEGVDDNGNPTHELVKTATPGTFEELPPGYDFKNFNPDYPHQNFDPFVKAMLRGISSGIGADYGTLSNDLVGATYSSIRTGKLETQDEWMCIQSLFEEWILEPLWPEWLDFAFVSGNLAPLPISKYDKFLPVLWQPRRWAWVDPKKDMEATELELKHFLTSPSEVIRSKGKDPETVWREFEKDAQRLKKLRDMMAPPPPVAPAGNTSTTPAPAGVSDSEEE
jgi:lambda family phage portal protein